MTIEEYVARRRAPGEPVVRIWSPTRLRGFGDCLFYTTCRGTRKLHYGYCYIVPESRLEVALKLGGQQARSPVG